MPGSHCTEPSFPANLFPLDGSAEFRTLQARSPHVVVLDIEVWHAPQARMVPKIHCGVIDAALALWHGRGCDQDHCAYGVAADGILNLLPKCV